MLSYAETRVVYGNFSRQATSRFAAHIAGAFERRENGLANLEIEQIVHSCQEL